MQDSSFSPLFSMYSLKNLNTVGSENRRIGSRIQLSKPSLDSLVEPALPHVLRPHGLCRLWGGGAGEQWPLASELVSRNVFIGFVSCNPIHYCVVFWFEVMTRLIIGSGSC
jgi:hypothetical protein